MPEVLTPNPVLLAERPGLWGPQILCALTEGQGAELDPEKFSKEPGAGRREEVLPTAPGYGGAPAPGAGERAGRGWETDGLLELPACLTLLDEQMPSRFLPLGPQ